MNEPSTNIKEPLRDSWVSHIFMRLHGRFGNGFLDKFKIGQTNQNGEDAGIVNAKEVWAKELAGYSGDELSLGIEAKYSYPPSCDEFAKACRPNENLDDESLFLQACNCALRRKNREPENWPSNRLFWAYQRIGPEILGERTRDLKKRFAVAYVEAEWDSGKPIPQQAESLSLPAAGKHTITQEDAKKRTEALRKAASVGISTQYTAWAYAIARDPKSVPTVSVEKAIKAFIAWGVDIPENLLQFAKLNGLDKFIPEIAE